jgi:hypothetical protein
MAILPSYNPIQTLESSTKPDIGNKCHSPGCTGRVPTRSSYPTRLEQGRCMPAHTSLCRTPAPPDERRRIRAGRFFIVWNKQPSSADQQDMKVLRSTQSQPSTPVVSDPTTARLAPTEPNKIFDSKLSYLVKETGQTVCATGLRPLGSRLGSL